MRRYALPFAFLAALGLAGCDSSTEHEHDDEMAMAVSDSTYARLLLSLIHI